jgi:hypothetical protein
MQCSHRLRALILAYRVARGLIIGVAEADRMASDQIVGPPPEDRQPTIASERVERQRRWPWPRQLIVLANRATKIQNGKRRCAMSIWLEPITAKAFLPSGKLYFTCRRIDDSLPGR